MDWCSVITYIICSLIRLQVSDLNSNYMNTNPKNQTILSFLLFMEIMITLTITHIVYLDFFGLFITDTS